MPTVPHDIAPSKAQWEAVVEDMIHAPVRVTTERALAEELTAAVGPPYRRRRR